MLNIQLSVEKINAMSDEALKAIGLDRATALAAAASQASASDAPAKPSWWAANKKYAVNTLVVGGAFAAGVAAKTGYDHYKKPGQQALPM